MYQINIHEAKTHLSRLVEEVALGEEIIIAKAGKPIAKLIPLEKNQSKARVPGGLKGQIRIADNFDGPLLESELALWNDAPIFPAE
ncbi:MAG: type II toxin-antitoxin system Phd/YefM family antitoxin [Methylococcaceae bacterium]|nr:type II toxin-antitoxin system Phd/YefM family antitoxin [Methylococcaceae bacterium]